MHTLKNVIKQVDKEVVCFYHSEYIVLNIKWGKWKYSTSKQSYLKNVF